MIVDQLYKTSISSPILRCVTEEEVRIIMKEYVEAIFKEELYLEIYSGSGTIGRVCYKIAHSS